MSIYVCVCVCVFAEYKMHLCAGVLKRNTNHCGSCMAIYMRQHFVLYRQIYTSLD